METSIYANDASLPYMATMAQWLHGTTRRDGPGLECGCSATGAVDASPAQRQKHEAASCGAGAAARRGWISATTPAILGAALAASCAAHHLRDERGEQLLTGRAGRNAREM